ncbi:MAG TPA: helix-turn-helix domain-containing protein [Terriglobia bacterium]|nr:helix-turn-helix domain-containing protein [Terriglobia bacterium]
MNGSVPIPARAGGIQPARTGSNSGPDAVVDELLAMHNFFDASDTVQVMYEMLRCVALDELSIDAAAVTFGLSPQSFYRAKEAFEQRGLAGLLRFRESQT